MFTANRNVSNSQLVHNGFYRLCHKGNCSSVVKSTCFQGCRVLNITDTVNVVAQNCKTTAAMQLSCAITCKMGGFIIYISYDRQALSLIGNN